MNLDEAIELMEAVINEVSVSKWKEAAKNSIPNREQKAQDTSNKFGEVVYPFRPAVYDKGHEKANNWEDAEHRLHRAKELANSLPNSNKPANALKKAATNSLAGREQKNNEASKELNKAVKGYNKKTEHTDADRKELVNVQNKWVDTQKREDKAKHLVNKPVRRHKRQEDGSYKLEDDKLAGLDEAIELMETVINEVSVGFLKRAAKSSLASRTEAAKNDRNNSKLEARRVHASNIAHSKLPETSKVSANKLRNAADNSIPGRKYEADKAAKKDVFGNAEDSNEFTNKMNRLDHAEQTKKLFNNPEALEIMEAIIKECAIFEVDIANATEEVPPSTNKIKKTKKDKETNKKTEVVSVADELFPKEGNAKQQEDQKILDKINQMIEGTATLEDLLHLVRGAKKRRVVGESLDEVSENEILLEELKNETLELLEMMDVSEWLYDKLKSDFNRAGNYLRNKAYGSVKKFAGKVGSALSHGKNKAEVQHHSDEYNKYATLHGIVKDNPNVSPADKFRVKNTMNQHAKNLKAADAKLKQSTKDVQDFQKVGNAFKKAGSAMKSGAAKVGGAIQKGAQAVSNAFKKPTQPTQQGSPTPARQSRCTRIGQCTP